MNLLPPIFEEILVLPAYRLWQELFCDKNKDEEEESDE